MRAHILISLALFFSFFTFNLLAVASTIHLVEMMSGRSGAKLTKFESILGRVGFWSAVREYRRIYPKGRLPLQVFAYRGAAVLCLLALLAHLYKIIASA